MKHVILAVCAIISVLLAGCTQPPIGGETDSHGCLVAAGYSWCDASQKCYRSWEENCTSTTGTNATGNQTQMPGSDRDSHGCIPSAGYTWCDASQKCYRSWEENCTSTAGSTGDQARKFCGNADVAAVYACGEYVRVVSSLLGGGSTFYKDGQQVAQCPVVAPDSMSDECKQLLLGNNCVEQEVNCTLSGSEALAIAVNGSCKTTGNVTGTPVYNENSETWWFDLDTVMSGCSPACVVFQNGSSEVNYRCTGLSIKTQSKPIIQVYEHATYGEILTDGLGKSLYAYAGDSLYTPTCTSECIRSWPPLVLSSGYTTNDTGIPGTVSTVTRSDGLIQVTYNGIPLYLYVYDEKQGDVRGQGVNFKWFVAQPNMTSIPASAQPQYT